MTAKEFYETIGQNYEEVLERLAGRAQEIR